MRWRTEGSDGQDALFEADVERHVGRGEFRGMEFFHVRAQRIINTLPDTGFLPFRHTVNAYRGCSHACTYCFARPTHDYLDLDVGEGFERQIVVKVNAVERLRAELHPRRWSGEAIAMGTNTDPYQRCEGKFRLTRQVVEILTEFANPFSILTKSTLALRNLDLLAEAAKRTEVRVDFSVGTLDDDVWRLTEPGTPNPRRRLRAVERFLEAGVPCGVLVAPVLPGLSDGEDQLGEVAEACRAIGVTPSGPVPLHLRPGVKEHVLAWARRHRPDLAERYQRTYTGTSLPAPERRQIAARFRRAAGPPPASPRNDPSVRPSAPPPPTPRTAPTRQLTLGL